MLESIQNLISSSGLKELEISPTELESESPEKEINKKEKTKENSIP